nr:hypothetical protein CFP56_54122 [Quercus suber]
MEGETFHEETLQEEKMNASSEAMLVQKLLESVEAQGEVLEKIISRLSKIEEDELKEGEEWDEEDKDGYERSKLTQEDINRMMIEGKGDVGSWEDHDWPEWTLTIGATQVNPARFILERDMDPSSDDNQYLMLTLDEE